VLLFDILGLRNNASLKILAFDQPGAPATSLAETELGKADTVTLVVLT
jgi:hypothetical protein